MTGTHTVLNLHMFGKVIYGIYTKIDSRTLLSHVKSLVFSSSLLFGPNRKCSNKVDGLIRVAIIRCIFHSRQLSCEQTFLCSTMPTQLHVACSITSVFRHTSLHPSSRPTFNVSSMEFCGQW